MSICFQVFNEKLLVQTYCWLKNQDLNYFSLNTILLLSYSIPLSIDVSEIFKFGASNASRLDLVCQILTVIGTDKSYDPVSVDYYYIRMLRYFAVRVEHKYIFGIPCYRSRKLEYVFLQEKAGDIIEWLLEQCAALVDISYRKTLLSTALAVGFKHKDELLKRKPQILKLDKDERLKEVTGRILDLLQVELDSNYSSLYV